MEDIVRDMKLKEKLKKKVVQTRKVSDRRRSSMAEAVVMQMGSSQSILLPDSSQGSTPSHSRKNSSAVDDKDVLDEVAKVIVEGDVR
jgi:hypothetical protein